MEEITIDVTNAPFYLKVVVVGEPGVGKTSLVHRYTKGEFTSDYKATIGVDFSAKDITWEDGSEIQLHLWDLAGQERINTQVNVYFRGAHGAICVVDATSEKSREMITKWKELVEKKTTRANGQPYAPPCLLVVNKIDLLDEELNQDDLDALATELGFLAAIPVSAKEGDGVDEAVKVLLTKLVENYYKDFKAGLEQPLDDDDIRLEEDEAFKATLRVRRPYACCSYM